MLSKIRHKMQGSAAIDPAPLQQFFCAHFGVPDVMHIDPFQGRPETWRLMTEHTLHVEIGSVVPNPFVFHFDPAADAEQQAMRCPLEPQSEVSRMLNDPMPPQKSWFRHPKSGEPMEPDLERACIYHIVTKHVWCSLRCRAALRVGFTHRGLNELYHLEDQRQLFSDAGAVRDGYMLVSQTPERGMDVHHEAQARAQNYCNDYFTATMALVTERNLLNCVVTVPGTVGRAARLPGFEPVPPPHEQLLVHLVGMEREKDPAADDQTLLNRVRAEWERKAEESRTLRPQHYMAVPINHVLAWGLRDPGYVEMHLGGARVESFRYRPPPGNAAGLDPNQPIVLYYLVNNITFDAMVEDFKSAWLGRVDERPLRSLYWDVVPVCQPTETPEECTGVMCARSHITYQVPPKLTPEQQDQLMPALHPRFPPCTQWRPYSALERAAMENQ